jgi:Domain of unknown function (DUF4386)
MGAFSGILQAVGLMRWVFVVPILASIQVNPTSSESTRAAVAIAFQVVHQYGGVAIGEYLGQTLLVAWTVGVGVVMLGSPLFKSWVAWWGLMTAPLLLVGQSELFATVIPGFPVVEATPIAHRFYPLGNLDVIGGYLLAASSPEAVSIFTSSNLIEL